VLNVLFIKLTGRPEFVRSAKRKAHNPLFFGMRNRPTFVMWFLRKLKIDNDLAHYLDLFFSCKWLKKAE
jgi:hypothetical protein